MAFLCIEHTVCNSAMDGKERRCAEETGVVGRHKRSEARQGA
jgi:hypothetical protein